MKIEVFKTNVVDPERAKSLVTLIESHFRGCTGNFDLEDCDRILRVVSDGDIESESLIDLLERAGCSAEVLPDIVQPEITFHETRYISSYR